MLLLRPDFGPGSGLLKNVPHLSFFSFSFCWGCCPSTGLALSSRIHNKTSSSPEILISHGVANSKWGNFSSNFFTWISKHFCVLFQAPSAQSPNYGQRWWHQKQNKGQCSSQLVSDDTGINGLKTGSLDNVLSEAFMIYMYSLYEQLHVNHVLNKYRFSVSANKCKVLRTWCTAHVNWETGHVKIIKLSIYMDTHGGFITDSMCTKFCLKDTHEGLEFPQQATDFILLKCTDWNWTKTCPNTSTFLIGPLSPRFISL